MVLRTEASKMFVDTSAYGCSVVICALPAAFADNSVYSLPVVLHDLLLGLRVFGAFLGNRHVRVREEIDP